MRKVSLLILFLFVILRSAHGQGVSAGTKEKPVPVVHGTVVLLTSAGTFDTLDRDALDVKLVNVYYRATVATNTFTQPIKGEVQEVYIKGKKVDLETNDISPGYLTTKDYGRIPIFFSSSMVSESCMLVFVESNIQKLRDKLKK